ncbi:MAG TPA: J domain-containing protein [Opitutales bacterium]|jgi:hypothetical protein|nr:J domain-containing protein [Opitutales bacterium]
MNDSPELLEFYRTLDLEPGASLEEVEQARETLAKTWDPNRFGKDPQQRRRAEKKLRQINRAYERLSSELKEGDDAVAVETLETEAPVEPAPDTGPKRHWSANIFLRSIWIVGILFAVGYLFFDSYARFQSIADTTKITWGDYEIPQADPTSTTGYAFNQHVQVMPALGTDGYHWIMQMERMLDGREGWRVRHVDYDGPPGGRDVHWSSSLHWLTAGLAWMDHIVTHAPMAVSLERTEPWSNTFVFGILMIVLPIIAMRRFGSIPAAILAISFVATYPYYEFSFVGYLDHHGLAASSDMLMVFFLAAAGAGWLRNEALSPENLSPTELALWRWLPDRKMAKVWMIASGIAAGTGLWISTASVIPAMFGVGLGALVSTGYLARDSALGADPFLRRKIPMLMGISVILGAVAVTAVVWLKWGVIWAIIAGLPLGITLGWLAIFGLLKGTSEKAPLGKADPTLWQLWGTAVAATSIFYYLLEYAPSHFTMRLEINHPFYALAAFGAGGLLCRLSWLLNGNGRAQGDFWRNQWFWVLVDIAVLGIFSAIGLLIFYFGDKVSQQDGLKLLFVGWMLGTAGYGVWRFFALSRAQTAKPDEAYWKKQWLAILGGLLMVGVLPATVCYFGESVFVIRPGFLLNLHTDYILEFRTFFKQMSFLSPMQIAGGISFIPITALPMLLLFSAPDLQRPWKAVLVIAMLPALVLLALAFVQIRWLGISCAMWCTGIVVAAAVTTLPGSAFRWKEGFRRPIGILLIIIVLVPFPIFSIYQWRATNLSKNAPPSELDLTQVVTRDVSERIRARLGSEQGVILSGPTTTTWMMYFGGFKGIGTLYWENVEGLRTSAAIYGSTGPWEDVKKLIDKNNVTHICIFSWDAFAEEYARLGQGMRLPPADDLKAQQDQARQLQDAFVVKLLTPGHTLPNWLRLIPYHLPEHPWLRYAYVILLEVVPEMTDQEAMLRHAQWAMATGNQNGYVLATSELGQLLQQNPNYYPALIQNALRLQVMGKPEEFQQAAKIVFDQLSQASTLVLEDRVELAVLLLNSGHTAEAVQQAAAALAMPTTDEKALRHILPERLGSIMQLAVNAPAGSYPAKTFDLGLSLLPSVGRAQVLSDEAVVAAETNPAQAVIYYHDALKASPDFYPAMSGLTMLLATSKDASVRNGAAAIDMGTKAAQAAHVQDAQNMELLAYANAEAGKWDDALFYANMATSFMQNNGKQTDDVAKWAEKVKLFQNHQAFHTM